MATMKKLADFVIDQTADSFTISDAPHYYFKTHIRFIFYFHVIGTVIINLMGITLSLVAFFYSHLHRESPIYSQVFHHYERLHVHSYYFWYHVVIFSFLALFTIQIVTSVVAVIGTHLRNPLFFWPHLFVIVVHNGILIVLLVCLIFLNFLLDKWVLVLPMTFLFFETFAAIDLIITALCYFYVLERFKMMKTYTSQTKQVRFKKNRRRNR
uniref:Uncharacterized protein n=2 Tax=Panagrolaimus sp. JU765 TaxID=591449 RepID=A0AC34QG73_9BILA